VKKKTTVLYIDQLNMFIRNFAALNLTNDKGDNVSGIYGCLQSYTSVINKFNPDVVLVAWEGRGSSKRRKAIMESYKQDRTFTGFNRSYEGNPEEEKKAFWGQIDRVREYIKDLPFYQASIEYLEADDLIAYCVENIFDDEEFENVIVSTDRDYFQLVSDRTKVFRPVKTKAAPTGQIVDSDFVKFETGCHPGNYILYKCLCGDKSDGIIGISGVGQKTFTKDFPFVVDLKESGDIYNIQDLLDYSSVKLAEGVKRYKKYISNKALIEKNYKVMQLLTPDMSNAAIQNIERTFTNFTPKFKSTQFRIKLITDSMSPRNITRWVDGFTNIRPRKISFE